MGTGMMFLLVFAICCVFEGDAHAAIEKPAAASVAALQQEGQTLAAPDDQHAYKNLGEGSGRRRRRRRRRRRDDPQPTLNPTLSPTLNPTLEPTSDPGLSGANLGPGTLNCPIFPGMPNSDGEGRPLFRDCIHNPPEALECPPVPPEEDWIGDKWFRVEDGTPTGKYMVDGCIACPPGYTLEAHFPHKEPISASCRQLDIKDWLPNTHCSPMVGNNWDGISGIPVAHNPGSTSCTTNALPKTTMYFKTFAPEDFLTFGVEISCALFKRSVCFKPDASAPSKCASMKQLSLQAIKVRSMRYTAGSPSKSAAVGIDFGENKLVLTVESPKQISNTNSIADALSQDSRISDKVVDLFLAKIWPDIVKFDQAYGMCNMLAQTS
jgi:hypothetical protein